MTPGIDLERKTENAIAERLKQHQPLSKLRFRRTSEDSARVNQDLIISAKRGEGDPPFSGVYRMEITVSLTMRHRKTVDTLPQFLALCFAMEQILCGVSTYELAQQISFGIPDFHCYEIAVTGKDDSPQEGKHSCVWSLYALAMGQSYATAASLQSNN
jgi:hypothetical protein